MNILRNPPVYISNPILLGIWSVIFLLRTWWTSNRKCRTSTGIIMADIRQKKNGYYYMHGRINFKVHYHEQY